MNKKVFFIGVVLVAVVSMVVVVLRAYYLRMNFTPLLCVDEELGRRCSFQALRLESDITDQADKERKFLSAEQKRCTSRDGIWKNLGGPTGWGNRLVPQKVDYYCYFPLPDEGRECRSNADCSGDCIVSLQYIRENYSETLLKQFDPITHPTLDCVGPCQGQCSKYLYYGGEYDIESVGKIRKRFQLQY